MTPGRATTTASPWATYRLTVEYDGTGFSGWQEQKNARTVVGELKACLGKAGCQVLDLGGAGRTDAGVHALAQVAHLRLARPIDVRALQEALDKHLPSTIAVLGIEPAEPRFHARHHAVSRSYVYQLARRRTALAKRYVWWVRDELDLGRMQEAAALLPGRHDFALFAEGAGESDASTLVEVESATVLEQGALVLVRIVASHFLWRMVRRVVGALVEVGAGRLSQAELAGLLRAEPLAPGRGLPAQWTAPGSGLFLERIRYAGEPPLGELTAVTLVPLFQAKAHRSTAPAPPTAKRPREPRGRPVPPRPKRRA
jgi:tRNA pseudouridine38-40 synthase